MPSSAKRGLASLLVGSSMPARTHPELRSRPAEQSPTPAIGVIGKYQLLSTAHLSMNTALLLDSWCNGHAHEAPTIVARNAHGWFLSTRSMSADCERALPADLMAAILFARRRGIDLLHFDCDGPTLPQLLVHDW